ncbi:MAG: DUF2227 family putative metal-binding protein [Candidatus Woesearchaeota archaeon]|jgi:hypothetical protein|nr:DUF2227 family putative metal-binding protein [Candidatus Woesearchaeota archaeon]
MRKFNHLIMSFGLSLWILYFGFEYDLFFVLFGSFFVGFFSFLPDLDIKFIKKLDKFNKENFYFFSVFILPLKYIFRHRGITHSIWIPFILIYFGEFIFINFFLVLIFRIFYLSFFLHIFEDMFTVSGVELFYPFTFRFRFFKFSTNSHFDFWFFNLISFLLTLSFFVSFLAFF